MLDIDMSERQNEFFSNDDIPSMPNDLISGRIGDYCYFLNPLGHSGVVVLFGEALDVFQSCQHEKKLGQIRNDLNWAKNNLQKLEKIIESLGNLEILILNKSFSEKLRQERIRKKKKRAMIWLQLTDECNLRCKYCYIKKTSSSMNLNLAKKIVAKITDDCYKNGFNEIIFKLAGGEPILRWQDARLLIDWSKKHLPNIKFHTITNGTLLPDNFIDYISSGKLGISLSLDGIGCWHDKQRPYINGRGSFANIDKNIDKLLSHNIHPYVLTTITNNNIKGITELAQYCIQRSLSFRFSLNREASKASDELKNNNLRLIQELSECYQWMSSNIPVKTSINQLHRFCDIDFAIPKIRSCGIGTNGIIVTTNGRICICQSAMSDPVGNAFQDDVVKTIANQNQYNPAKNRVDKIPVCKNCEWRFVCGGGCPLFTKHYYGDFAHPSPYCSVYRAILPELLKLHALQFIKRYSIKEGGDKNGGNGYSGHARQ